MIKYEKIGDIIFPVEYTEDGLVLMYYPDQEFPIKENKIDQRYIKMLEELDIKITLGK